MTFSAIANEANKPSMADKIAFIKARQQGFNPETDLQEKRMNHFLKLQEITQEIADELLPRQAEANRQIAEFTEKVITILSDNQESALAEKSDLKLQELQNCRQELQSLLPEVQQGLALQQQHRQEAIARLEALQKMLKATPALSSFTKFLNQAGDKMCDHSARGGTPQIDTSLGNRMNQMGQQMGRSTFENYKSVTF